MKFLADMGISVSTARRLRDHGYDMTISECDDAHLLQQWMLKWQDLVEFEIIPVVPSKETVETITPMP